MFIDTTSGETAAALETRIVNEKQKVFVSKNSGISLAYSANGLVLRQKEDVETHEYRGLSQAAAVKLLSLASNAVTSTIYYKAIGSNGDVAAVGIQTGTVVDLTVSRDGDSGVFTVTRVDTTYSAASTAGWDTTRPASSSTGVVTSKSKRSNRVYTYNGDSIYSYQETTTTEYRFLTQAEAASKVSAETSDSVGYTTYKHDATVSGSTIVGATVAVQTGTTKTASSRYVDADRGFTVTVNATTYTASGTNWYT